MMMYKCPGCGITSQTWPVDTIFLSGDFEHRVTVTSPPDDFVCWVIGKDGGDPILLTIDRIHHLVRRERRKP